MLRVVVVDDEPLARQGMRQLLAAHPSLHLVGEAGSVMSAAELIAREKPDAIFLDIEMHSGVGFDLLGELSDPPDVVFVTAHSQYAVKAYDVSAIDYLLKPVNPDRLASAVAKLERARQNRRAADNGKPVDQRAVLRLKARAKTINIPIDAIVAMRAEGDYTRVLAEKMSPILAEQSLGKIEALLPNPPFIRLGRSLIINAQRLDEIEFVDRDTTYIRLNGSAERFLLRRAAAAKLEKFQVSARSRASL